MANAPTRPQLHFISQNWMHTTRHHSLHAPTKHRRCTPCDREHHRLLITIHITTMCNQYLQHTARWSMTNTTQNHNCTTRKRSIFDIKTSVNETKQQSTRLEKIINIHNESRSAQVWGIVPQAFVQPQMFVFGLMNLCEPLQTRCCNWSLAKHYTRNTYNIHDRALKCSISFNPLLHHVDLQKICLHWHILTMWLAAPILQW